MDDKPTVRGGGTALVLALVAIVMVLPMLYALSLGPVIWLATSGFLSESWIPAIEKIYWPLRLIADNVPIVGPAIEQYASWWRRANPAPANPSGS